LAAPLAFFFTPSQEIAMHRELLDGEAVFVLHDFFSAAECDDAIARAEAAGFEEAPITTAGGAVMAKDIRNNARLMVDDIDLAARLFERARPMLPANPLRAWEVVGLNERWRYYRYGPGERFAPHYDGSFVRGEDENSQLTFMIYLNDDFAGGETKFYFLSKEPYVTVKPVRGQALVFVHWKLHEGAPVLSGRKYVLRTDVMCRRVKASGSPADRRES
jgi:hypothetical protein